MEKTTSMGGMGETSAAILSLRAQAMLLQQSPMKSVNINRYNWLSLTGIAEQRQSIPH
ncbi:MAG: hypothetical protein AAF738_00305 [Bacteroidota bacterium]